MANESRIEDLRRRVQKEPASIAFAQLAEEYRRAGRFEESADTCRAGLARHPGYLSARVTLGRALIELGQLDEAQVELRIVLKSAPDNLAALRGVAEIYRQQGALSQALVQYRAAFALAPNDPELEETVDDLVRALGQVTRRPEASEGLSLAEMKDALADRGTIAGQGDPAPDDPGRARAIRTLAVLDHWLAAIHATRSQLGA